MDDIDELIEALKSDDFIEAAEESYYSHTKNKEDSNVSFEEYIYTLRGLFIEEYICAITEEEIYYIMESLKNSDVEAVDANSIFKLIEATKSKIGDLVEKDIIKELEKMSDYKDEPIYNELSKYNKDIAKYIKKENFYYSIKQIKMGNYEMGINYRLSQKEIRMIENVKMIGPINRIIHANYDTNDFLWPYCEYNEIPGDSVLKRFAFHTNEENPMLNVIFEDGTIVEYLCGDLRVPSYNFQSLLVLTKLNIVKILNENEIFDMKEISKKEFKQVLDLAIGISLDDLSALDEVYTKKMIDDCKQELDDIKQFAKDYNL